MVFVRTGVTDNTYTEITGGDLQEGMEVITGENAQASSSSSRNSSNLRRGMMFMR
jgi:HlyD family secretion protein